MYGEYNRTKTAAEREQEARLARVMQIHLQLSNLQRQLHRNPMIGLQVRALKSELKQLYKLI